MRLRTTTRAAVTALAAMSVVLGVATPSSAGGLAASADSLDAATAAASDGQDHRAHTGPADAEPDGSSSSPAAAPAAAPSSTAKQEPASTTAPAHAPAGEPSAGGPAPAARGVQSTIALALAVAKDGNGPFTAEDQPGGDANATNGIVRTLDAITYRVTMNSDGGESSNERFTLTAPTGTSWAGVTARCRGAGSAVRGQELTCNLGTIAEGQAVAVPAVLNVSGDRKNGDTITVSGTGTADNADAGSVSATSPTTAVSAAARYNLSKDVHASTLRTGVTGPDGKADGVQLIYPIAVDWQPLVAGQGMLGFEKSVGSMTFTDDVSKLLGDLPSNAVLWNGGNPVCGPNAVNDWRMRGLPGGKGGGENAVVDSGTFTCTQDAPGRDIHVALSGTVTDPTSIPTRNVSNGPIAGGAKAYFVSGYISLWMPNPPFGTSVDSVNTYTPLQTISASGAPNFPGSTEPTADNSAKRNIIEYAPGGVQKHLFRVSENGTRIGPGSAKQGDPWATAGTLLRSDIDAWNDGVSAFDNVILCDGFDRNTQVLTRVGRSNTVAWTNGLRDARVQYAAYDMPSATAGQDATCNDDDGPWYDQPEDVPGGLGAVGKVRATGDIPGGDTASLYSYVTTKAAANGTRAYDFGHAWFGDRSPRWVHDIWSDADLGAGPLSDSVILTENLARITKKIVDAGHDASDTPDETSFAVAGNTIDYALYPTLTNGKATGIPADVTVQDVLPLHTDYVAGSASEPPEVDTITDPQGREHQRLTWKLTDVTPNHAIDPLTYTAAVSDLAPGGPITNVATIASPTDESDAQYRDAQRAVQIVITGGVGVEKTAIAPVVVNGDHLEWKLGYTNTDASPIRDVDLIDVLPFQDDTRHSSFHGTTGLAEPVQVDQNAQERVTYTDAEPGDVVMDGKDPSNQEGGSTTWCAESDFGADGCPDDLSDVTAIRIQRGTPVAVGDTVAHRIALATEGAHDDDTYTNRFGLRASNLDLPVQSNPATIRVVSGAIGDHVWTDENSNGIQDAGEPGIEDVAVRLTGTDDLGAKIDRATTTDTDGNYRFGGLRPGEYVVTFTAPDGREFTREHAGTDRAEDSDATSDGSTAATTIDRVTTRGGALDGVDRIDTIDAGILPEQDGIDPQDPDEPGSTAEPDPTEPGHSGTPNRSQPSSAWATDHAPSTKPHAGSRTKAGELAFTGTDGLPLTIGGSLLFLGLGAALHGISRARGR